MTPPAPAFTTSRPADIRRLMSFVRVAAMRAIKIRYRGSVLGVLWSFTNPLLMTAMYTVVFGTAFSRYYDGSILRYLLSAFVGLTVVTFFLNATAEALPTIVTNGALLNKIALPPAAFPLSSVAADLVQQLCTTFPAVFIIGIAVTHDPLRVALIPVALMGLVLLTAGFSLALSALYVFFRDVSYLWGVAGFMLWMTSPLFYPAQVAPERIRVWFRINPISQQISALRELALQRGPIHFADIGLAFGTALVAFGLGVGLFRLARRQFMDLL